MEALSQDQDSIVYPESDGRPMADNTLQFRWIVMLKEDLDALLSDFVAGDLLWYPVKGDNQTRAAPDTMVALGRPKGERGSYKQWEEGGIAPQVVFEVLSPGNTQQEMEDKLAFYDKFGVDEYYVIDPDVQSLEVYARRRGALRPVDYDEQHVSKKLGIRFVRRDGQLQVFRPDGKPFLAFGELVAQHESLVAQHASVVAHHDSVVAERDALAAKLDTAEARAARLAERLRALGIDPDEG